MQLTIYSGYVCILQEIYVRTKKQKQSKKTKSTQYDCIGAYTQEYIYALRVKWIL